MKREFFTFVLFLFIIFYASDQSFATDNWTGNVNLIYGIKKLDKFNKYDWDKTDKQKLMGLNMDFGMKAWPVNIAISFVQSKDDFTYYYDNGVYRYSAKKEDSTKEYRLGIKKIWKPTPKTHPFLVAGCAMIYAESKETFKSSLGGIEYSGKTVYDARSPGLCLWFNGGIYWTLAGHFNLGIDLAYSKGQAIYESRYAYEGLHASEVGGIHYGLFLGYHW